MAADFNNFFMSVRFESYDDIIFLCNNMKINNTLFVEDVKRGKISTEQ